MVWQVIRQLFGVTTPTAKPARDDAPKVFQAHALIFDPTAARLSVVGESFYQDALEAIGGRALGRGLERTGHLAALSPEPWNPKDADAIAVLIEGHIVGHLSRENARLYRPVLDLVANIGLGVGCHASLIGGWDRGAGARGSIGVVLHLGTPEQLMTELDSNALIASPTVANRGVVQNLTPDIPSSGSLGDLTGKVVCFTGESACTVDGRWMSRLTQEILATNAGLHVLPRVTKKLDLLVVSPLVGRTGKVARAEQYGINRVDEAAFWHAIGVAID